MNSEHLQELQEAYTQVQQLDEISTKLAGKVVNARIERTGAAADRENKARTPQNVRDTVAAADKEARARKLAAGVRSRRKSQKDESYDTYNTIFSYLIDEGFASTEESADKIILNMSESWFEEILEARRSEKEGKGSPESPLSYPGRVTQKQRGEMGGRHWQSGGEGGSKTERGRKKSDKHSQAQRLRGLSTYPEKPGKYAEIQRKKRGGDIGSRFD